MRWIAISRAGKEAKFERLWACCFAGCSELTREAYRSAKCTPLVPRKNGVSIKWPGDDVKVDFLARYDDRAGTKPERGENLTVTATMPPKTAELDGSVRTALPTGRVFDVTIPAGFEDRSGCAVEASPDRRQAGRRTDNHQDRTLAIGKTPQIGQALAAGRLARLTFR